MIEILGIEDDVAEKTRMQRIKIIRKEIDSKLESGEKVTRTCLEQLFAYMKVTVPPLSNQRTNRLRNRAKRMSYWSKNRKKERRGKNQKGARRARGSGAYFKPAIEKKGGPVLAAQRI